MKVNKEQTNKKGVLKVYHRQCAFFGIEPKTEFEIAKLSAHKLYELCQEDYMKQPKGDKAKWLEHLGLRDRWLTRMRKRFFPVRLR